MAMDAKKQKVFAWFMLDFTFDSSSLFLSFTSQPIKKGEKKNEENLSLLYLHENNELSFLQT